MTFFSPRWVLRQNIYTLLHTVERGTLFVCTQGCVLVGNFNMMKSSIHMQSQLLNIETNMLRTTLQFTTAPKFLWYIYNIYQSIALREQLGCSWRCHKWGCAATRRKTMTRETFKLWSKKEFYRGEIQKKQDNMQ